MRVLQEGALLADRYTLIRRLGVGGMSEVWLADDKHGDARVALKVLNDDLCGDDGAKERFKQEWRIGSRMMHASIVRVFEYHEDEFGPFFSLQHAGDADISIVAGKDVASIFRPIGLVCDALRYAHAKDVVHCDIKASNIVLDGRGAPYIIDFGVAAAAGSTQNAGGGSDISKSPQQIAGNAAQSADDIFALGVLIHELLTGVPPVRAETMQINVTMLDGSLLPPAVQSLLNEMLSSDAARRPDAETVAAQLNVAGFSAGAVPRRDLGGAAVVDQVSESVEAIRPVQRAARSKLVKEAEPSQTAGGTNRLIYGGLGIALLLLIFVVFVLPNVVSTDAPTNIDSGTVAEDLTDIDEPEEDVVTEISQDPADVAALKSQTDEALGDLLSQLERLRYRAIERWGGQPYLDAVDVYAEADEAYVNKNYQLAGDRYRKASEMLEPFFGRIDEVFNETLESAAEAFERSDPSEAVRLYDLAVAITPGNGEATAGLARALNLESVLTLTSQGRQFESDLELDAAKTAYERALELDSVWEPALAGLERVRIAIKQLSFEQRMTEGFEALANKDYPSAQAAFGAAKILDPTSRQPADGLLQVDQEIKLENIRGLEQEAAQLIADEQWEISIGVYQNILQIDADLQFAQQGLSQARQRSALHAKLQGLIDQPDNLADPANIQSATTLLLDVAKVSPRGPRLEEQKNELSRLLKRAATPLQVQLVSDNATNVSVFKIGRLGMFTQHELSLRPGVYVAVGNRAGYRDVRIEFRVAPEDAMQPVVVQCEEQI